MNLNDLGTLNRGKSRHRPRNDASLYNGDYPFVQTGDIKNAELHLVSHSQTYNEKGLQQSKLWEKGTLCITIAANIAETSILSYDACFPDSIVGFHPFEGVSDVYYVKYLIDYMKETMQQASKGTTQDNLSLDKFASFEFDVPNITSQRKQAYPLVLCDLIVENNNRRIAILEEMAQRLYREWFVHFRFPGYENVELVDSELGKIPEGWSISDIESCCSVLRRGISPKYNDDAIGIVINQKCIRDFSINLQLARKQEKTFLAELQVQYGDVLINSTGVGTLGRVAQMYESVSNCTVDSHVTLLRPEKNSIYYMGSYFREKQEAIMDMGVGSTGQTELNRDKIKELLILIPDNDTVRKYEEYVGNLMSLKTQLQKKSATLRKTRDLLLPRLMSGDVDVSNIEL